MFGAQSINKTLGKNGVFQAYGYYRKLIGNGMLKVKPTSQCGLTITGSGLNGFDLGIFTLSVA